MYPGLEKYAPNRKWCMYPAGTWNYCWGWATKIDAGWDRNKEMPGCQHCEFHKTNRFLERFYGYRWLCEMGYIIHPK